MPNNRETIFFKIVQSLNHRLKTPLAFYQIWSFFVDKNIELVKTENYYDSEKYIETYIKFKRIETEKNLLTDDFLETNLLKPTL